VDEATSCLDPSAETNIPIFRAIVISQRLSTFSNFGRVLSSHPGASLKTEIAVLFWR
jgi:hypothetical protein